MYLSYHNFISVRINFAFYTSLKASPWEQRKLGDVVKRESVTQVSSTEYPAIEYEDVIPETGQLNKDIYKKGVQKAGILFDANKVLYGKLRPYLHNWVAPMYKGVAVGDWWVLNPCGLDRGFLYTLIQTVKFDTIANQSTGSKMPRADWKLLSTTEFSIPSLDEQIKIGKLVEGLNDYITLHQRKLEKLQATKKALLYELFPIENSRRPKRRFKGFTDDWEQRKLSKLATMNARIGWQNLRTSEFLDSGDYLLITGTDFDNGRIKYSTCHYVEKKRFDQDTKIQLSTGSILITKDGTLGKVALVEELPKPATLNAGVFNVRVKDDAFLSYKYLYHYLKAPFLMKYVIANATGGTIKHLNQSILVDFPIPITEKHEQDKIAKLLDSLESIITLHQ